MRKLIGMLNGVEVWSDPNVPRGKIYLLNGVDPLMIYNFTRWQRFTNWIKKKILRRY